MKFSESWLREWIDPKLSLKALCDKLTMAGLEVEEFIPVAKPFEHVVIGEIKSVIAHPEADQLFVCEVIVDKQKPPLQIVCGAQNVSPGLKVAVALIGATLPNGIKVKETTIRGVQSAGMLCSQQELELGIQKEGIWELGKDAPIGERVWDYLNLSDNIIDLSITPNRGDCLSIKGIAREVSALTGLSYHFPSITKIPAVITDTLEIKLSAEADCPHYIGRIIRDVNLNISTPVWLAERLRRSNIRSINIIVDIVNYVMLELGQPMHAFDLDTLGKQIEVRHSRGEQILLLDESEKELDHATVVIADENNVLAIAGVMGGINSSVTNNTKHIFLESAFFTPSSVAKQRQHYQLASDSAYRYERYVDPSIQMMAIERASQLILQYAGGKPGPHVEREVASSLPKTQQIKLPADKISQLLGLHIDTESIEYILTRLEFKWLKTENGWLVESPIFRSDIQIAEDLIEEIARIYGYQHIPTTDIQSVLVGNHGIGNEMDYSCLRQTLVHKGYHEIISYSFVDEKIQTLLSNHTERHLQLVNPITTDMTVMRNSLWPGLIKTYQLNHSRQQHRIRLYEVGIIFLHQHDQIIHRPTLAGLISGMTFPEQWGTSKQAVDFFDIKGDVWELLQQQYDLNHISIERTNHRALHPGQAADIYLKQQKIGTMGLIHPQLKQQLDINDQLYLFEIDLSHWSGAPKPIAQEISKFPLIRRDLALLVNDAIPAKAIQDTIRNYASDLLVDLFIFDVYQGKGIEPGKKSIAVALILQHATRTLVDEEVAGLMERVIAGLKDQLGAELRS